MTRGHFHSQGRLHSPRGRGRPRLAPGSCQNKGPDEHMAPGGSPKTQRAGERRRKPDVRHIPGSGCVSSKDRHTAHSTFRKNTQKHKYHISAWGCLPAGGGEWERSGTARRVRVEANETRRSLQTSPRRCVTWLSHDAGAQRQSPAQAADAPPAARGGAHTRYLFITRLLASLALSCSSGARRRPVRRAATEEPGERLRDRMRKRGHPAPGWAAAGV